MDASCSFRCEPLPLTPGRFPPSLQLLRIHGFTARRAAGPPARGASHLRPHRADAAWRPRRTTQTSRCHKLPKWSSNPSRRSSLAKRYANDRARTPGLMRAAPEKKLRAVPPFCRWLDRNDRNVCLLRRGSSGRRRSAFYCWKQAFPSTPALREDALSRPPGMERHPE